MLAQSGLSTLTLEAWLKHIEKSSPGQPMDFGEFQQIGRALGITHFHCPIITIGGTNGKGSCVAAMENILLAAGYRVAAYTSPHLLRFNERIRINGIPIADEFLPQYFTKISLLAQPLSYFQFITLAALVLFQKTELDVILLEVGIGGRLDAVNIVESDVAVITSIDFDHVEKLGNSIDSIAKEKAGIIRANKPVVLGEGVPEVLINLAKEKSAKLIQAGIDYSYARYNDRWIFRFSDLALNLPVAKLLLANLSAGIAALKCLPLRLSSQAITQGIASVQLAGRFEVMDKPVKGIFDVAHNPASCRLLAQQLLANPIAGKTFAVFAALADKDIKGMLEPLLAHVDFWYIGSLAGEQRALASEKICAKLQEIGETRCYNASSIENAFASALANMQLGDRLLIFGSFRTVATVKSYIERGNYGNKD